MPDVDLLSGVSADDRPWLNISEDRRPGPDDRAVADGDVGANEGVGADPNVVADGDGRFQKLHRGACVIVRAGAKMGLLGNGSSPPNRDRAEVVEARGVPDGGEITDGEQPGVFDADGWVDVDVSADLGSK